MRFIREIGSWLTFETPQNRAYAVGGLPQATLFGLCLHLTMENPKSGPVLRLITHIDAETEGGAPFEITFDFDIRAIKRVRVLDDDEPEDMGAITSQEPLFADHRRAGMLDRVKVTYDPAGIYIHGLDAALRRLQDPVPGHSLRDMYQLVKAGSFTYYEYAPRNRIEATFETLLQEYYACTDLLYLRRPVRREPAQRQAYVPVEDTFTPASSDRAASRHSRPAIELTSTASFMTARSSASFATAPESIWSVETNRESSSRSYWVEDYS